MQSAGPAQYVETGTEIEMVRVAENDPGVYIVAQFALVNRLNGADSPDGHENRGGNHTVVCGYLTGAGIGAFRCCFQFEIHTRDCFKNAKLRLFWFKHKFQCKCRKNKMLE